MKKYRILSAFLAVLMFCGTLAVIPAGAIPLTYDGVVLEDGTGTINHAASIEDYLTVTTEESPVSTSRGKLDLMELMWESNGYQIWADAVTGEVAVVKTETGEMIFTNPWDVSTSKTNSMDQKKELLSQIIVNYTDNGTTKTMNSCVDAAMRGQIKIKHIKNGIRVEYAIGRQNARFLVPRLISRTAFETKILLPMREAINEKVQIKITEFPTYRENEQPVYRKSAGKKVSTIYTDAYEAGKIEIGQSYSYYDLMQIINPDFNMQGEVDYTYDHQYLKELLVYYQIQDPNKEGLSDKQIADMNKAYPITKKMAVYVFDEAARNTELIKAERHIKNWLPDYTFEQLDADHLETEYTGTAKAPALFKLALEYTVDMYGLNVRLPANGIRFDESLYQLDSITVLPFMGAGKSSNGGYNFLPDGSGALFDYEKLNNKSNTTLSAKVYGVDYAYHTITGKHQEVVRYPVFGSVENWKGLKTVTDYDNLISPEEKDENGNIITDAVYGTTMIETQEDRGFFAIIEEGDSMAEIATVHLNGSSEYSSMKMTFYPRPTDSYLMEGAISVGSNKPFKVVSSRKYVGNYKIKYIMLSDEDLAKEVGANRYYDCSWVGMAEAYRDYLEYTGVIKRLAEDDVDKNIPLYIETFGTVETVEKILSMPVNVMAPLTTFEDIKTMYTKLSDAIEKEMNEIAKENEANKKDNEANKEDPEYQDKNVGAITKENADKFSNINFKLTGYANGGIYSSVPYHLNWEESVGGAAGFQDLVDTAREEGFGIFPDFNFAYIDHDEMFDGADLMQHAVKTIDNRYTSRREYDATYQTYVGYYELALSPAYFGRFVTKLSINYLKYNPSGISVSSLGTALNSDFDEDEPYNREDSMQFTVNALRQLSLLRNDLGEDMKVMTSGGNAYTLQYIDYIVDAPMDSSSYNTASYTVPFVGFVLHGYKQYAGTPINEEGNIQSALLKAIENGSGLYFKLSYQNTDLLKEFKQLSKNYSIDYENWEEKVVELYVELNNCLADLQTKLIIDHEFLVANRIPSLEESIADEKAKAEAEALAEAEKQAAEAKKLLTEAFNLRKTPGVKRDEVAQALKNAIDYTTAATKAAAKIDSKYVNDAYDVLKVAKEAEIAADSILEALSNDEATQVGRIMSAYDAYLRSINEATSKGALKEDIKNGDYAKYEAAKEAAEAIYGEASKAYINNGGTPEAIQEALTLKKNFDSAQSAYNKAKAAYDEAVAETKSELGTTAAESEIVKQKMKELDAAKVKLDEATKYYANVSSSALYAAAVDALQKVEKAEEVANLVQQAINEGEKVNGYIASSSPIIGIAANMLIEVEERYAEYDEYTPTLRKNISALESAYKSALAGLAASEAAVAEATAAVEELLKKYNATKDNAEATAEEIAKAEQFYTSAQKALDKAEADLALIKTELAKIEAIRKEAKILDAKVHVLGDEDVENNFDDALENGNAALEGIGGTAEKPNAGIIDDAQAIVDAKDANAKAKAEYDAAKKIYDELLLVDISTLTAAEAAEYRAKRMEAAIIMSKAEATIKENNTKIENKTLLFNDRFLGIVDSYAKLESSRAELEAIVEAAALLRETSADAKATYEAATAALATINVLYDDAKKAFENLCEISLRGGLITENNELVVPGETEEGDKGIGNNKTEGYNKYTYDDGSVISVTYGGKNGNDSEAYRTFVINYNAFDVTVVYGGEELTIGAYGYYVINH